MKSFIVLAACLFGLVAGQTSPVAPTPDPNFDCPNNNSYGGYYPYPGDCSKYYECANGLAWQLQCPGELHFNPAAQLCDYPENANCDNGQRQREHVVQETSPVAPTPDPNFKCPNDDEEGGYFSYPGDCTKYYECANGLAWQLQCSGGLYFNPNTNYCDYPQNVECDNGGKPVKQFPRGQEIIGPAENFTCTAEMKGAYPHEELCEYYYDCWEESASLGRCTEGFLFDLTYLGCNYPEYTDCGDRIRPNNTVGTTTTKRPTTTRIPGTGPTDVTEPSSEFECPELDGFFAHPSDCSKFYQCVGGIFYLNSCPDNLVWNQQSLYCDYLSNVPECQTL